MPNKSKILSFQNLIFLTIFLFPLTRIFSGYNLIFLIFIIFIYIFFHKNKIFFINKNLLLFVFFSLIYAFLSFINILPKSWTVFFSVSAIPQQSLFILMIPLLVFIFHEKIEFNLIKKINLSYFFFFNYFLYKIIDFVFINNDRNILDLFTIRTLSNSSCLLISFFLFNLYYVDKKFYKFFLLTIFLIISLISPFAQNYIFAILVILIWLFPNRVKAIIIIYIISSLMAYFYLSKNLELARLIDNNLPIRIIMTKDAIIGSALTNFIGVGFGTESITNNYYEYGIYNFYDNQNQKLIFMSPHNSFATIFFRTGLIGLILFLIFIKSLFNNIFLSKDRKLISLKGSAFVGFFTLIYINPGLESFEYMLSCAVFISIILSKDKFTKDENTSTS